MKAEGEKYCTNCKETKPHSDFWKNASRADGLQAFCKPCCAPNTYEYNAQYYKDNRQRLELYNKEYRRKHKEKRAAQKRTQYLNNPEAARAGGQRHRARKRRLPATLMQDEWNNTLAVFGGKCVYCGNEWEHQDHLMPVALGGGYTKENIVPACAHCNKSKNAVHPADWIEEERLEWILEKLGLDELPIVLMNAGHKEAK